MENNIITEKKSAMPILELPLDKILRTKWIIGMLTRMYETFHLQFTLTGGRKNGKEKSFCLTCELFSPNVIQGHTDHKQTWHLWSSLYFSLLEFYFSCYAINVQLYCLVFALLMFDKLIFEIKHDLQAIEKIRFGTQIAKSAYLSEIREWKHKIH